VLLEHSFGHAVIRMAVCHGAAAAIIVDYLASPEWLRPLFARGVEYLRNVGAAAVYCTTLGPGVGAWTRPLGFIRRESTLRLMGQVSALSGHPAGCCSAEVSALPGQPRNGRWGSV
jgi:hypothetical protein